MPGDGWRYRLELVPFSGADPRDDDRELASSISDDGWELVSTRVFEDGRTEQRMYRKLA